MVIVRRIWSVVRMNIVARVWVIVGGVESVKLNLRIVFRSMIRFVVVMG
jgi:hypothetical protein